MKAPEDVVVTAVARLLIGPSIIVAVGLLVKGYTEVGDGFSAGVMVVLMIALHYVGRGPVATENRLRGLRHAPKLAVGGMVLALISGFYPLALGEPLLLHHPEPGQPVPTFGKAELFTPLVFDIGIFLLVVGSLTVLLHRLMRPDDSVAEQPRGREPT